MDLLTNGKTIIIWKNVCGVFSKYRVYIHLRSCPQANLINQVYLLSFF